MNSRSIRIATLAALNLAVAGWLLFPYTSCIWLRPEFDKACPAPEWLRQDAPTGCSHYEMQKIFETYRHDRSAEWMLGSSGYLSTRRCPEVPEVALYNLMLLAQSDYKEIDSCSTFLLDRYNGYRSANGPDPADQTYLVAGAVGHVGQALIKQQKNEQARILYEWMYKGHGAELPSYVYQGFAYYYGEALMRTGRSEEGAAFVRDAISKFDTPEKARLKALLIDLEDGE